MSSFRAVPQRKEPAPNRVMYRFKRRLWPILLSLTFVALGLLYCFRWGPVVQHVPSLWLIPKDLPHTYYATIALAHGHFGAIYQPGVAFLSYPGILIAFAWLGGLSSVFGGSIVEIGLNHQLLAHPQVLRVNDVNSLLLAQSPGFSSGREYVLHASVFTALIPAALVVSCVALFACDALAERLKVSPVHRVVLGIGEAVLLWNVTVLWGHPEDAVAVALAIYALILALDGRFAGAGWLFGAALAFQPLVLPLLPVVIAMAGRRHGLGVALRSVLPPAALLAVPLIANFRDTLHDLVDQPTFPSADHVTPWTALAPRLGGGGPTLVVAGGPGRVLAIIIAIGLGVWVARRRIERPELLVYACFIALALRSYTESVMTPYYPWAALAFGLVLAARCSRWRFSIAVVLAITTTILAQLRIGWIPWWTLQIAGLTALLVVAAKADALPPRETTKSGRDRPASTVQKRTVSSTAAKSSARRTQPPAAQPRSQSGARKKDRTNPAPNRRSGPR
jgi:hypothetical protein